MKLIRFGPPGREKPGLMLSGGRKIDVTAFGEDYNESFFGSGGLGRLAGWLEGNGSSAPEIEESARLAPPVSRPGKIVCVGLNYEDHARESGADLPEEPILFFKATSSVAGPYDNLVLPRGSTKTDWEVELAVIIGEKASYVTEAEAMDHVAGYCVHNDYSERAWQLERGGQWVKGKSCDTFAPLGPFMATRDEIEDINDLRLWLKVNGEIKQNGSTSKLIFGIPHLVSYISGFMTLMPGDIISTGTPAGVGLGFDPPRYLQPGDVVELGIEGLGSSKQHVKAYKDNGG
ncbi:fumarylacetoacetate hydrolase family protein [Fodinibius sp.]|uniref:fumarylacetoacetate hydrolase family protein n=1 Tax=Fodinibius sp. TaxID=1872440 RepID=UPI003564D327